MHAHTKSAENLSVLDGFGHSEVQVHYRFFICSLCPFWKQIESLL